MSLITQALVSADEVDGYLQIQNPEHDTIIEYIINGVSQQFSTYAKRSFISATYTALKLTGDGTAYLWLPNWPVTALTSVAEDGVTRTVDVDFYSDATNGVLEKAKLNWPWYDYQAVWSTKTNAIVITYTAGYALASLPADLKLASLKEIARQYQIYLEKGHGESSRSIEGSSVSFADRPQPEWMEVVGRYRRMRV